MIGIRGPRGVGKTTFLLQYARDHFDPQLQQCLYINMNNFYFQGRGIVDFAGEFVRYGGRVLLIDQVFKQPNWAEALVECYNRYEKLHIVYTTSSVIPPESESLRELQKNKRQLRAARILVQGIHKLADRIELPRLQPRRNPERPRADTENNTSESAPVELPARLPAPRTLPVLPRNTQLHGAAAQIDKHDDRGRHPFHQTNRPEIPVEDKETPVPHRA